MSRHKLRKNVSRRRSGENRVKKIGTEEEKFGSDSIRDSEDEEMVLEDWRHLVTSTQRFLQFQRGNTAEHYAKTKPRMMSIELKEKARKAHFGGAKATETVKAVASNGTAGKSRRTAEAREVKDKTNKKDERKHSISCSIEFLGWEYSNL